MPTVNVLTARFLLAAVHLGQCSDDPFNLRPLGHSYFSVDPVKSASFFTNYLGAKEVSQNVTSNLSCAEVAAVEYGNSTVIFVKDKVKLAGPTPASAAVSAATAAWDEVTVTRETNYSQWIDFHDGFDVSVGIDVDRLLADNISLQVYHNALSQFPNAIVRFPLPGTSWTLEKLGVWPLDVAKKIERFNMKNPDSCRNLSRGPPHSAFTNSWWKATFATPDPEAATEFAVKVLGATAVESPYPWPPKANCTIARWVWFKKAGFMLHFVKSQEWPTPGLSVSQYAKYQESLRNLRGGVFDQHMYNNLILWTDSLDAFVTRLRSLSVPFLAFQLGGGLYAVFVDIPGNGVTLQIRSTHLTVMTPPVFDACTRSAESPSIIV